MTATPKTWYRSVPLNPSYKTEHENGSVTVERVPLGSVINNQGNIKEYGIQTDTSPFTSLGSHHILLQVTEDTALDLTRGFTLTQTPNKNTWNLREKCLDDFKELAQRARPSDNPALLLISEIVYITNP